MKKGDMVRIARGNGEYNNLIGEVVVGNTDPLLIKGEGLNGAVVNNRPCPGHRYVLNNSLEVVENE